MEATEIIKLPSNAKYKFLVNKTIIFKVPGMDVGKWDMYDCESGTIGKLMAKGRGNTVEVYHGFRWDGSTVVGNFFENEVTLKGSILHDILYIVAKNNNFKSTFNLFQADIWFRKYMSDSFNHPSFIPWCYYIGLTIFGWPWKIGKTRGWLITDKVLY